MAYRITGGYAKLAQKGEPSSRPIGRDVVIETHMGVSIYNRVNGTEEGARKRRIRKPAGATYRLYEALGRKARENRNNGQWASIHVWGKRQNDRAPTRIAALNQPTENTVIRKARDTGDR